MSAYEELADRLDARLKSHGGKMLDAGYYSERYKRTITHQEVYLTICETLLYFAHAFDADDSIIEDLEDTLNKLHWGELV